MDEETGRGLASTPSLLETAIQLLSGQVESSSMRISSLVSALYDVSASFKDEIKHAGGAKLWLSDHPDKFIVDTNCSPGHESVALRLRGSIDRLTDEQAETMKGPDVAGRPDAAACVTNGSSLVRLDGERMRCGDGHAIHSEGSDDAEPSTRRNGVLRSPSLALVDDSDFNDSQLYPFSWSASERVSADAADDAAAAALLVVVSEESTDDPIMIEKKIRAVQKKLRRVQVIEELVGQGSSLDNGQQALFASKPRLLAQLHQLLQQWAVLEPALLEQQEQRMLAIANSECAICLEEYDSDRPGIRTSCCGYHFHRRCLQQCLDTAGLCPICSASKGSCKVVEQRVRQAA
uniref:RING-type domain-containing protein n=1 Tax=Haptolina ericina TaxID=156174 RepID=A0A6T9NRR5_9EUKA